VKYAVKPTETSANLRNNRLPWTIQIYARRHSAFAAQSAEIGVSHTSVTIAQSNGKAFLNCVKRKWRELTSSNYVIVQVLILTASRSPDEITGPADRNRTDADERRCLPPDEGQDC